MSPEQVPGVGPPASATSVNGMVLNVVLPGLGTLIYGKSKGVGVAQLVLFLVGLMLCLTLIGILIGGPMMLGAWIWSIISGVAMLSAGTQNPPPPAAGP
jgi:hypothetical protein